MLPHETTRNLPDILEAAFVNAVAVCCCDYTLFSVLFRQVHKSLHQKHRDEQRIRGTKHFGYRQADHTAEPCADNDVEEHPDSAHETYRRIEPVLASNCIPADSRKEGLGMT